MTGRLSPCTSSSPLDEQMDDRRAGPGRVAPVQSAVAGPSTEDDHVTAEESSIMCNLDRTEQNQRNNDSQDFGCVPSAALLILTAVQPDEQKLQQSHLRLPQYIHTVHYCKKTLLETETELLLWLWWISTDEWQLLKHHHVLSHVETSESDQRQRSNFLRPRTQL